MSQQLTSSQKGSASRPCVPVRDEVGDWLQQIPHTAMPSFRSHPVTEQASCVRAGRSEPKELGNHTCTGNKPAADRPSVLEQST